MISFAQVARQLFDQGINVQSSPLFLAYAKSPLYHPNQYDAGGNLYDKLVDKDELGVGNPVALVTAGENEKKNYRFTASLMPEYRFSDRFTVSALAAFSWDKIRENNFLPDYGLAELEFYNEQGDWYGEGRNMVAGMMTRHSSLTLGANVFYRPIETGLHRLDLRGGLRFLSDNLKSTYGRGYNTGSDNLKSLSVTNSALRNLDGIDDAWKTLSWTADGQITNVPRATYGDPMGNARFSDRWIEDASYMKLKQLSLSYQLPIKSGFVQGINLWVAVDNVFTVTRYLGSDPEFSYGYSPLLQGIDAGLTPQARVYRVGLKLNL